MENRYDIVVVGGGPNGLGIACYLAKTGLSVCVVEDRMELGGGIENAEPMPGFRIDPHATYFYGAAAPFLEQMELHKFGFRMIHYRAMMGGVTSEARRLPLGVTTQNKRLRISRSFRRRILSSGSCSSCRCWRTRSTYCARSIGRRHRPKVTCTNGATCHL